MRTLHFRRHHKALFAEGEYVPLVATGTKAEHACAFARIRKGAGHAQALVVVVPRLVTGLTAGEERPSLGREVWQDTRLTLPEGYAGCEFRNVFTGETVTACMHQSTPCLTVASVLASFPVALLELVPHPQESKAHA
jgi:(1->4)-alpha-D-glucan 1-alpha-D-glucosylmutase